MDRRPDAQVSLQGRIYCSSCRGSCQQAALSCQPSQELPHPKSHINVRRRQGDKGQAILAQSRTNLTGCMGSGVPVSQRSFPSVHPLPPSAFHRCWSKVCSLINTPHVNSVSQTNSKGSQPATSPWPVFNCILGFLLFAYLNFITSYTSPRIR